MKQYYVLTWQYWETNKHRWGRAIHIYTDKQTRDEHLKNLCPCIHEYPKTFEQTYTDEEIAEFLLKEEYCIHL